MQLLKMKPLKQLNLVLVAALSLLALSLPPARADFTLGTKVPLPTAAGQIPISQAGGGGFTYAPVGFLYTDGVHVTFGGGAAGTNSVLTANVVGASDGGLRINLPAGYIGNAVGVYNASGSLVFGVTSIGNIAGPFNTGNGGAILNYVGGPYNNIIRLDGAASGYYGHQIAIVAGNASGQPASGALLVRQYGANTGNILTLQSGTTPTTVAFVTSAGLVSAASGYASGNTNGLTQDVTMTSGTTTVLHFKGGLFTGAN